MPIYEYLCEKGHTFEKRQSFSAEPISICPECSAKAKRVFHAVPVMFKGSGWYVTDHGRGMRGDSSSSEAKSPTSTSDKNGSSQPSKTTESKSSDTKSSPPTSPAPSKTSS